MKKNTISLMLIAVVISGCSSKQVYDNIQHNAQLECQKLPSSTYQKCMERYSESFEPYTQKREDFLRDQKQHASNLSRKSENNQGQGGDDE